MKLSIYAIAAIAAISTTPSVNALFTDCIPTPIASHEVCQRDYVWVGTTTPYECTGTTPGACCTDGDDTREPGMALGTCTKMAASASKDVLETDPAVDADGDGIMDCIPTGALAPVARLGQSPEAICKRDYAFTGQLTPYSCTGPPSFACCSNTAATVEPGMGLGTCTLMSASPTKSPTKAPTKASTPLPTRAMSSAGSTAAKASSFAFVGMLATVAIAFL